VRLKISHQKIICVKVIGKMKEEWASFVKEAKVLRVPYSLGIKQWLKSLL
jgi:hypothetical protein